MERADDRADGAASGQVVVDELLDHDQWLAGIADATRKGLVSTPKWLPPVWFYDETGSRLFDQITRLPEYYPTRAERSLLIDHADEIVELTKCDSLVELGSGTSDKTVHLLDALDRAGRLERYLPFDVSGETLRDAADRLLERYPSMAVHAVVGDFNQHLVDIPRGGRRLVAFLGGTIGNLSPDERRGFLTELASVMDADDHLLLGVDLVKDPTVLVAAYDDTLGVTAAFNRNALAHLNHRFGAGFDIDDFEHLARWNVTEGWIEMVLRTTSAQDVDLGELGGRVAFAAGEEMRTEISTKFRPEGVEAELVESGFATDARWVAEPGFQLTVAHPY